MQRESSIQIAGYPATPVDFAHGTVALSLYRVSRLEANEKRSIRHGDFTSRDGTSFNLRVARPREVAVSGKNLEGKTFEATLPWQ